MVDQHASHRTFQNVYHASEASDSSVNLRKWNKCTFGNIFKDKEAIQHEMETMQHSIMDIGYTVDLKTK